jgi:Actin like proteins N terminal domain
MVAAKQDPIVQIGKARKPMKLVSIDAGNFEIKACWGSEPIAIRSVFKKLPSSANMPRHNDLNPVIELANGDRFALGQYASVMQGNQPMATTRKEQYALLSVLTCLTPELCQSPLKLVFSHFQPELEADALVEKLHGTHRFKRNGKALSVDIEQVEIIPEGLGSLWAAKSRGLLPDSGLTLLVDIGGGSYLARVIDQSGYEVAPSVTSAKGGTVALAGSIAADGRLVQALSDRGVRGIKTAPIMEAFQDETYRYAETGVSFKNWMHEHIDSWFEAIIDEVSTSFEGYNDRITKILFTGGAANIVKSKIQGNEMFLLMPKASLANVVGSYSHFRGLGNDTI